MEKTYSNIDGRNTDHVIEAISRGPGLETTSEVDTHSKGPYFAAFSIALGTPREQAFACTNATLMFQCMLANLSPIDRRVKQTDLDLSTNNWMLSKLSELFSNGNIRSVWVGSMVVRMMHKTTGASIYKNLPSIIESNVGSSARAIFEQTLAELQKS